MKIAVVIVASTIMASFAFPAAPAEAAGHGSRTLPFVNRVIPGESWFGGVVSCGLDMPWTADTKGFRRDLRKEHLAL